MPPMGPQGKCHNGKKQKPKNRVASLWAKLYGGKCDGKCESDELMCEAFPCGVTGLKNALCA